jgi:hypothetical protein
LRYNPAVRLIVTITWCVAALLWTPWALLLLRLIMDLALGASLSSSNYTVPALQGIWPGYSWLSWRIVSWYPVCACLGMALTAAGWRLYWWSEGYRLTRSMSVVAGSILCPLFAPFIMWRDAVARHRQRQAELAAAVNDVLQRQQVQL